MLMHNTDDQFLCTLSSVLCQSGSIAQQEIIYAYANPLPDSHCIDSICIWVSKCYYKYCYFFTWSLWVWTYAAWTVDETHWHKLIWYNNWLHGK